MNETMTFFLLVLIGAMLGGSVGYFFGYAGVICLGIGILWGGMLAVIAAANW